MRNADLIYPGGAFALESCLTWIYGLAHQEEWGLLAGGWLTR